MKGNKKMAHLSVTINKKNEIEKLIALGIKEVIINLKDSSFSTFSGFSVEEIIDIKKCIIIIGG